MLWIIDGRKSKHSPRNTVLITLYYSLTTCSGKTSRAVKEVKIKSFLLVQMRNITHFIYKKIRCILQIEKWRICKRHFHHKHLLYLSIEPVKTCAIQFFSGISFWSGLTIYSCKTQKYVDELESKML